MTTCVIERPEQREQQDVDASGDDAELEQLAEKIASEYRQTAMCYANGLTHAIACGHHLTAAKAKVKHGEWASWLDRNCDVPDRTARVYMQLAKAADEGRLEENGNGVADLSLRTAVALLRKQQRTNAESAGADTGNKQARKRMTDFSFIDKTELIESVTARIEKEQGEKQVEIAQSIIDILTAGIKEAQQYIPGK